jgi:hypothetical protein
MPDMFIIYWTYQEFTLNLFYAITLRKKLVQLTDLTNKISMFKVPLML